MATQGVSNEPGSSKTTYTAQLGYPLLAQIKDGHLPDPAYAASVSFNETGTADLIVNNLDEFITHPYHLHGREFYIVKRGSGNLTAEDWIKNRWTEAQLLNPLKRDVITIPLGSCAVLRESHCHHQASRSRSTVI